MIMSLTNQNDLNSWKLKKMIKVIHENMDIKF